MNRVPEAIAAVAELGLLPNWVLWRAESRDGKITKVPYAAPGRKAAVDNPRSWTTYARAQAALGDFDGLGFVFTETAYCGIDLDHCIDDAGTVEAWALAIVQRFSSYTERTPSGRGLHIWIRGRLPGGHGRKRGGWGAASTGAVELYSTGRYFTVTGTHLPETPATIETRQAELDHFLAKHFPSRPAPQPGAPASNGHTEPLRLTDRLLLSKATAAKNGPAFERLWAGDWTGYASPSEADAALCAHLAWWTRRDAERVDRLFRRSGLMREKWDDRRGAETYGATTIARACDLVTTGYDPRQAEAARAATAVMVTPAAPPEVAPPAPDDPAALGLVVTCLEDVAPVAVAWLWASRVARGKLTVLAGDPGLGKSFVTLDMAARISTGQPWPDGAPSVQGAVILLSAEDGPADTIRPRVDALGGDPARIHLVQAIRDADGERAVSLDRDLPVLERLIATLRPVLVVIDPLTAYLGTTDSYKDADVRRLLAPLARLADQYHVAALSVMHLTKNSQTRAIYRTGGSIGFVGAARGLLLVAPDPEDEARRILVAKKNNLTAPPPALAYRITEDPPGTPARVVWDPEPVAEGLDADALLAGSGEDPAERQDADALLRDLLADGERPSTELSQAARANGISERTLERARRRLRVRTRHVGRPGQRGVWYCSLPDPPAPKTASSSPPKAAISPEVAAFGEPSERTDETARTSPKTATSPNMAAFGGGLRGDGSLPTPPTPPGDERL